ncbi:hypothetical protein SO3561_00280 [Streptomyces olivochromogenes]|uniref:Lipoprotein n=1 Tax=Streptomyces olivochromogenes TaxID=1963 RepID=A0A250V3N1_STROL|nr:hypothetical protein SO3561_00280 [Streptomyces olivochromogenes]
MRWWAGWTAVAGVVLLAACGGSGGAGRGPSSGPTSASTSASASASTGGTAEPGRGAPSASGPGSAAAVASCFAGRVEVTVSPGDAVERRLCVRAGTVVSLTLRPRADDRRWTAVRSAAPAVVLVSGWRVDADGTGRATLRCASVRGGAAGITVTAKAPDVAGAARTAFTLRMSVVPYAKEG